MALRIFLVDFPAFNLSTAVQSLNEPCDQYILDELRAIEKEVTGLAPFTTSPTDEALPDAYRPLPIDQLSDRILSRLEEWARSMEENHIIPATIQKKHTADALTKMLVLKAMIEEFAIMAQRYRSKPKPFFYRMLRFFLFDSTILFLDEIKQCIFDKGKDDFSQFALSLLTDGEIQNQQYLSFYKSFLLLQIVKKWPCNGFFFVTYLHQNKILYTMNETEGAWAKLFEQAHVHYSSDGGVEFLFNHFRIVNLYPVIKNGISGLRKSYKKNKNMEVMNTLITLIIKIDDVPLNAQEKQYGTQSFVKKVKRCKTADEVLTVYHKYKNYKILTTRRNPNFDDFRTKCYRSSYTEAQIIFIEACQLAFIRLYVPGKHYPLDDLFSQTHCLNMGNRFKGWIFLQSEIKNCNGPKKTITVYDEYKQHEMLTTHCRSRLGHYIAGFFQPAYTPQKIDFIEMIQIKINQFSTQADENQSDLYSEEHRTQMGGRFVRRK